MAKGNEGSREVKISNQLTLTWGGGPGLSKWTQCNHKGSLKVGEGDRKERQREVRTESKMGETQGEKVLAHCGWLGRRRKRPRAKARGRSPEVGESKDVESSPELPEGSTALKTLLF